MSDFLYGYQQNEIAMKAPSSNDMVSGSKNKHRGISTMWKHHSVMLHVHCLSCYTLHTKVCISSHTLRRKCWITMRFTGHSKIVGPQYGTHFMSPFQHLLFGGGS